MAQAEFEFWNFDSAFEKSVSISACLQETDITAILERLRKKAEKKYKLKTLRETFTRFGWGALLPPTQLDNPLSSKQYLTAEETRTYFYNKILQVYGQNGRNVATKDNVLSVIYFAEKTIELIDGQNREGVKVLSLKGEIDFLRIVRYFFTENERNPDRLYTSVLTALIYAVAEDFKAELEEAQSKVTGYALMKSAFILNKKIDEDLLDFLDIIKSAEVKRGNTSYRLICNLDQHQLEGLSLLCSKWDFVYRRHGKRRSIITMTAPLRILANYFGIEGVLKKSSIRGIFYSEKIQEALKKRDDERDGLQKPMPTAPEKQAMPHPTPTKPEKLTKQERNKILKRYADGKQITLSYLSEKEPELYAKICSNFLTLRNGMVVKTDALLDLTIQKILLEFLQKVPKQKLESSAAHMRLLCRFTSEAKKNQARYSNYKSLCDEIYVKTTTHEVENVYEQYFPNDKSITNKKRPA